MKVKYKKWNCYTNFQKYENDNIALILNDQKDHCCVSKASINPDIILNENEIAIKNYSENKGIEEALLKAKVIEGEPKYIHRGYINIPIYKLTEQAIKEIKNIEEM